MELKELQYINGPEKLHKITPKNQGFKMLVASRFLHHYLQNPYEEFTADLLLNLSKDGMLFIDVGAHYGFYSLLVGTNHKKSKIIAFEPVPANYKILKKNLNLNRLSNIETYNLALSEKEEIKQLNIAEASNSSGFYEHPLSKTIKTIRTRTLALDNFLKDIPKGPVIIKMDTEGYEIHVLRGMKNILRNTEDIKLIIEFNPKMLRRAGFQPGDLLKELSQFGFDVFFINDPQREIYKLRVNDFQNWSNYVDEESYRNILCVKGKKSLSVCFFSHSSLLTGAERSLLELVTELIRDHGIICSVILPGDGPLRKKLEEVGASTLTANYDWWCDSTSLADEEIARRLDHNFTAILGHVNEKVGKINPDVILTNTIVIPWGAVVASLLNKPHVWSIREYGEFNFYLPFQSILKIIRDCSNIVLTNSTSVKKALFGNTSAPNILTIGQYIDIPQNALDEDKSNYFTRTNSTKLAIIGTVSVPKGQEDAILAVRELVKRKKDIELIIVGYSDECYLEELKHLVEDDNLEEYVRFLDFKENVYPIINQTDIVLVCSRSEAFGRVTLEAMLLKKPIVGTNTGGTVELIKKGFNGLLYEPGNHKQLADKIEYLIQHREKMRQFGENGNKFAKEHFTKEQYGGKVHKIVMNLINKKNPSSSSYWQFVTRNALRTFSTLEVTVRDKEARLRELETAIKDKEIHISQLEDMVREREVALECLRTDLAEKEREMVSLNEAVSQRDSKISELSGILSQRGEVINGLNEGLHQKDIHISRLEGAVREKEREIVSLNETVGQRDSKISELSGILSQRGEVINGLNEGLHQRDIHVSHLEGMVREKEAALNHIYNSHGWKALLAYYKLRDKILPVNSKRRKAAKFVWNFPSNINLSSVRLVTKRNIKRSFSYIRIYGIRAFTEKILWKLNSVKTDIFYKPRVPKLNLPVVKEDQVLPYADATVSVVIPTKNGGSDFELLLSMLKKQKGLKEIEIVVVDSGSSDETLEIAKIFGARIIEIPQEKFSHSFSRNIGAENCSGEYIFFTVQDAMPPSELFLYELLNVLQNNDVAAVSCAEFPKEDIDLFYRVLIWNHYKFLDVDRDDRIVSLPETETHIDLRKNGQLSDLACLISKNIFMNYKYLCDYAEDLDLGIRLIRDGYKLAFLSSIKIIHSHNRPPYYFLKRGYVDNLFLTNIFPDYPIPTIQGQRLFRDILLTYHSINSLINEDLSQIKTSIGVEQLFGIVERQLNFPDGLKYTSPSNHIDCPQMDDGFKSFLKEVSEVYHVSEGHTSSDSILNHAVLNFMNIAKEYMGSAYQIVDGDVLDDFKLLIVKTYALQCGAHLAYCYSKNGDVIEGFHKRLKEGI